MMTYRTILNLTGRTTTAHDFLRGVYDPGPYTDSAIAGRLRGMNRENAAEQAKVIASIAELEGATMALIDGEPYAIKALTAALEAWEIHAITRHAFDGLMPHMTGAAPV